MGRCNSCQKESPLISESLSLCSDCIRAEFRKVLPQLEKSHSLSRERFNLPSTPPRDPNGISCYLCSNQCKIPQGGTGYCGLRRNKSGRLKGGGAQRGNLSWYYDHLPTNCVADWVCPGGSNAGYPQFSYSRGPEYGYRNLAVFYQACSFNCLFCQNWHFRELTARPYGITPEELVSKVDTKTACICYFGGDPTPQLPHALLTSQKAVKVNRILRICWETNGSMSSTLLKKMIELSLKSGGCIKFDLKCWNEEIHIALCGISNRQTLENFRLAASFISQRPDLPLLVASTPLVPGYVDWEEITHVARFIASLNPEIPYALLAFHPQFYMRDLPTTSRSHAQRCLEAAKGEGLKRIRVGNLHLLGNGY